jgi:ureidoacrylate peracid hydrolase
MADTALLMIDMQNMYLSDDGVREAYGWPPIWRLSETAAECAALLAEARSQAVPVIYSRNVTGGAGATGMSPRFARLDEYLGDRLPEVAPEHRLWKTQIMDAVAPQAGDLVLDKTARAFSTTRSWSRCFVIWG